MLASFLVVAVMLGAASISASLQPYSAVVDVGAILTEPLPPDFASISSEVQCAPMFINGARNSYINLLSFLRNTSGGTKGPNIRIGGNSADWDWYSNDPTAKPPTPLDTILVNDSMIESYRKVAEWAEAWLLRCR